MNIDDRSKPPDDDRALKEALKALPLASDPARIEALQQRVIAQWQQTQGAPAGGGRGAAAWLSGFSVRRGWLAGATGLALGLALLVGTWLHPSDPVLDELLQPDVLSQMAAGEM